MANPTVKTRVLIISDTHCAPLTKGDAVLERQERLVGPPFEKPLPKADVLIHCGDLTMTGKTPEYHATLDMLKHIDAPVKLVIAGNHDLTLDRDFLRSHLNFSRRTEDDADASWREARELWTSASGRARKEGVTFLDEGVHTIDLPNGARATVYASAYTPEFMDWAFPYERDEDRFNSPGTGLSDAKNIAPYPVPSFSQTRTPVDILVTHGPPFQRLDRTTRGDFAGCPHLLRALMRARPLVHCFGHIHEGRGAERVRWGEAADRLVSTSCTIEDWMGGNWKAGIEDGSVQSLEIDEDEESEAHGAFVDLTSSGGRQLERGKETMLVNAAIMNIRYHPVNGPWVLDLDLPRASLS